MSVTDRDTRRPPHAGDNVRVTRWVATIAGLIGFVLSVATPLLPVVQTTAMLNWPQNGQLNSVTAPLISLTPVDLTATVPCERGARHARRPAGWCWAPRRKKGKDANLNALFVVVNKQRVDVTDRNVVIVSVPREQVVSRAVPAHRDHLDPGRDFRHLRRAERPGGQAECAAASPTPTCARRSSGCSPT